MKHILFAAIAAFGLSTSAMACGGNGEACPMGKQECQKQQQHCKYDKAMPCDHNGETCPLGKEECQKQHQGAKMTPEAKAEWKAKHEQRMSEHFEKADTNHDGQLSKEEFMAAKKEFRGKGHHGKAK